MQGTKIQASVLRKEAHERFNKGIHETRIYQIQTFEVGVNSYDYRASRHSYRLTFNPHTVFLPDDAAVPRAIPTVSYSFVSFSDIFSMSDKESDTYLIGIVCCCYICFVDSVGYGAYNVCCALLIDVYGFVKCMGSLEELNGEGYPRQILTMQLADAK